MTKGLTLKAISPMEKCFLDESIDAKAEQTHFIAFRGESAAFQAAFFTDEVLPSIAKARVVLSGDAAKWASVREVVCIANTYPAHNVNRAGEYLRTEVGLYPDLIRPLRYRGAVPLHPNQLHSLWIEIEPPSDAAAGEYKLCVTLEPWSGSFEGASTEITLTLLDRALPPQRLIHTEWLYTDCIANAHKTEIFSEEHWTLIEKYVRTAARSGINMILTPVFTPELDTYIGGERRTTQLVDITVESDGSYSFGMEKLERWIDMCLECGIAYFEIPHFFTQWGAAHAPKFVATVDGEERRIFGWETDADSKEYTDFLSCFIPALLSVFKGRGLDKSCYFHISDEPSIKSLERYRLSKEKVAPMLEGYNIIDALSDYDFYKLGVLKKPVPAIKRIKPFLENDIEGLWAYYCGASGTPVPTTDRCVSMPLSRTRILGVQLYLARIEGFLHWGYNFYYTRFSKRRINPYVITDGDAFAPAGDAFSVYPAPGGKPYRSLRLVAFHEAVNDMRALKLAEKLCGREAVLAELEKRGEMTFSSYPMDAEFILTLRENINRMIGGAI